MVNTSTQKQQHLFSSEHGFLILRALQTVKTPVVFEIDEIVAERGVKARNIQKQFSRIKERYGLNIGTKISGHVGRNDASALVLATKKSPPKTLPKALNMKAIEWHGATGDESDEKDTVDVPETPRRSGRSTKLTPKKREYSSSDSDEDLGNDTTWNSPPWSNNASAKRQKRFWHPDSVPEHETKIKTDIKTDY